MKKIMFAVLIMVFGLFGCYNIEQNNYEKCDALIPECGYYVPPLPCCPGCDCPIDNNIISVTLSPDSPKGEIPPGNDRLLAIFTINSNEPQELYGLELEVVHNYPYYWFVDEIWFEDETGNLVSPRQAIYDGFAFWGVYGLPAGETRIKVMGHVVFGEPPDYDRDPRPEFRVKVNGVYASADVEYAHNLQGNLQIPKYNSYTYVSTALS